jgi:tetratricopeptide (TPR) repeat protein
VVDVAEALHWFSDQWIFWGHWPEVFGTAARCAHALGDPLLEATQLNYHAWALILCEGRPRDGLRKAAEALAAARRAADPGQRAWAHTYTAWALRLLDEPDRAAEENDSAAALFEAAGDLLGRLQCLQARAFVLDGQRRDAEALAAYRKVLDRVDEAGDRVQEHVGAVLRLGGHAGIGKACARLGLWEEAVTHLRTAVGMCRALGNTALESRRLLELGEALLAVGRAAEARETLAHCAALGPGADPERVRRARERLAGLGAPRKRSLGAQRENVP